MEHPPSLPGRFDSPLLPLSASAGVNFAVTHGRGTPPRSVSWYLVNITTENAWQPGDQMDVFSGQMANNAFTKWMNAMQVGLRGNNTIQTTYYAAKDTGSSFNITAAKWKLKCVCDW